MKRPSTALALALVTISIATCGFRSKSPPTDTDAQPSTLRPTTVDVTATLMVARTASTPQPPLSAATTANSTAVAVHTPRARTSETPMSSVTPVVDDAPGPSHTPIVTPTLSPRVTGTPSPGGACPAPGDETPPIVPITPGTGIIEGFEPQIRAYLDAGGSAAGLQAALSELSLADGDGTIWQARAQVIAVDVTGNGTTDVVVGLTFLSEGDFADGGLFVFHCRDGRYQGGAVAPLGGQVLPEGSPDPGIRVVQDLNANGLADIVFSYIEIVGTHANFTRLIRVVEWDGSRFMDLIQSDAYPPNAAPVLNGDGVVLDTNGDGTLELVLTNGIGHGYEDGGPQRARNDIWAWNGHAFTLNRLDYEPPIYRFQAVQDGDEAARVGDYARALAFYEQAISDDGLLGWSPGQLWPDTAYGTAPTPPPDPSERSRLTAYATYRMMLVYVLQGALEEAQATYQTLAQMPQSVDGRQYADLAGVFWEEYSTGGDLALACAKAVEFAETQADAVLAPLGRGFYGYYNRNYEADALCPFE